MATDVETASRDVDMITCDVCGGDHETEECPEIKVEQLDTSIQKTISRARLSLPSNLDIVEQLNGCIRVISKAVIAAKTRFGPLEAKRTTQELDIPNGFMLRVFGRGNACTVSLDTSNEDECNWLCLVQTARSQVEQNCMVFQIGADLFYNTTREIQIGEELRVWYAPHYAKKIGMSTLPDRTVRALVSLNIANYEENPPDIQMMEDQEEVRVMFLPEEQVTPLRGNMQQILQTPEKTIVATFVSTPGSVASHAAGSPFGTPDHQIISTASPEPGTPIQDVYEAPKTADVSPTPGTSLLVNPDQGQMVVFSESIYDGNMFKCRRCDAWFATSQDLAKHVQAHLKSYKCKLCKQRFFKKMALNRHFKLFHRLNKDTEIGQKMLSSPLDQLSQESDEEPEPSSTHHVVLDGSKTTYIELVKSSPKKRQRKGSNDSNYTADARQMSDRRHKYHTRGKQTNFKALAGFNTYKDRKERSLSEMIVEDDVSEKGDVEVLVHGDESGVLTQAEADVIQTLLNATEIDSNNTEKMETAAAVAGVSFDTPSGDDEALEGDEVPPTGAEDEGGENGFGSGHSSKMEVVMESTVRPSSGVGFIMDDDIEKTERLLTKGKLEDLMFKEKFEDGRYALYETQSGVQAFKCGFCEICCTKLESIKAHMEKHAEKKFCEDCRRFFDTQEQLEKHLCRSRIKNLMPNPDGFFSCPDCGKLFKSRENLEPHYIGHSQNFNCQKCFRVFMRKETLEKHTCLAEKDAPSALHHCDICGATFRNMKYLFRHMTGHTRDLVCKKCEKSFSRKQSLLQHLNKCYPEQLIEMNVEIHACSKCSKVFSDDAKLKNHMVWHEGKYRCEGCGKQFSTQMTLTGHVCAGKSPSNSEAEVQDEDNNQVVKFECRVCQKVFTKEEHLDRHMITHSDKFKCKMCKKSFGRKLDLEMHEIVCQARISIQEKGFVKCTVCDSEFFNVNEFFKHSLEHSTPYKCGSCQRPYRSMHALEEHTKVCTGEWSDTTCPTCGKVFRDVRYLDRHKLLHTRPKYECEHCHKMFHRKDYYGYHMCKRPDGTVVRVKHSHAAQNKFPEEDPQPHLCPTCGKSYVSVGNLNKHMKRHGEKQFQCPTCARRFHLKATLKTHMQFVHTKIKGAQCPHCGKMLKSKNTVLAHIKYFHHDNVMIYTCETCGKTFRQKGNLLKHQLVHTEGRTLQCPYCDRMFKYPEQLGKHKLEHEHGRRYACQDCEKTFVKEYDLRHHIEVFHSGIMYTCEFCNTDCRHTHTMRRHIRRRHPEKVHVMDQPDYVKSLQRTVMNPDGTIRTNIHHTKASSTVQPVHQVTAEEVTDVIENITQTEEAVHSLQQIQTINIGGTEIQVIEEDPNNQDVAAIIDNVMSHEAAEVLQSLASNTQDPGVSVAAFTDIPNFAVDGAATHVIHHDVETQEYILVPLIQAENSINNVTVKSE
ncbi:PR domain zinc finger protein 15-like [Lineus longissimus]|uniref:PR domain zinc finger protein 15-like n=1 Tax=Lineus longissimus TaxID=88925 RepID=UPI00315C6E12